MKVLEKEKKDGTVDQEFMETMLGLMMESMREENLADFTNNTINMTAEEILRVAEPNTTEGETKKKRC